jgi:hypothetical protein
MNVGDRICVLFGGKTPFILRPQNRLPKESCKIEEVFGFVGDAYVHGLMDGEAIKMIGSGELQSDSFLLR